MPKILIATLLALLLAAGVSAQDAATPEDTAGESAETDIEGNDAPEVAEAGAEEEIDDSDLDEQTYEEDEDDFVPTEEIPADEPIPFPTNI